MQTLQRNLRELQNLEQQLDSVFKRIRSKKMRLTSPSPVYRGIFATFLAGSRQVSGKVLKQHQERRLQQLLLKRQIVMV
ncbi:hypothetical protein CXB51_000332 [Gossypium anomalum]|uniref:Uncharacterized protein n=1 Tax=Gossypium anomalum TaxID=47600 RepID=A0A8J5ZK59_9ROSI|nr:hypothetical protein CXB51_000332 [Gossypium anomalum]